MRMYDVIIRFYFVHIRIHLHTYAPSYSQPTTNMFAYLRLITIENVLCRTSYVVVEHQSYMLSWDVVQFHS